MGHRAHARRAYSGIKRFEFFAPTSREALLPADHFYRQLEAKVDLSFARDLVRDCYGELGQPSIDPVVFFKLQRSALGAGLRVSKSPTGAALRPPQDPRFRRWQLGLHQRRYG